MNARQIPLLSKHFPMENDLTEMARGSLSLSEKGKLFQQILSNAILFGYEPSVKSKFCCKCIEYLGS